LDSIQIWGQWPSYNRTFKFKFKFKLSFAHKLLARNILLVRAWCCLCGHTHDTGLRQRVLKSAGEVEWEREWSRLNRLQIKHVTLKHASFTSQLRNMHRSHHNSETCIVHITTPKHASNDNCQEPIICLNDHLAYNMLMHHVVTTLLIKPPITLTNGSQNTLKICLLFLFLYLTGMLWNRPYYPCALGLSLLCKMYQPRVDGVLKQRGNIFFF
jgi:hypothetical protein